MDSPQALVWLSRNPNYVGEGFRGNFDYHGYVSVVSQS